MATGVHTQFSEEDQRYHITGKINSELNLSLLHQSSKPRLVLNLQGIEEINSIGIKLWINEIRELQEQGKTIEYQACSTLFMRQINFIKTLREEILIHSGEVIFECEMCDEFITELIRLDVDPVTLPPEVHCPECGQRIYPEDEQVFNFITNK